MNSCLLCGAPFVSPFSFIALLSWPSQPPRYLCPHCRQKFEHLSTQRCRFCAKNLERGTLCQDCLYWQEKYGQNLLRHHALYRYNAAFHDLMVAYKRYGDYLLRKVLQDLCYQGLLKLQFDYYVPVPTSPEHQAKRQFDTITAIYQDLVPLTNLLGKKKGSHAQAKKSRAQRLKSKQDFFVTNAALIKKKASSVKILLLDDIYTTGRTLYHARDEILTACPSARIESFSICR